MNCVWILLSLVLIASAVPDSVYDDDQVKDESVETHDCEKNEVWMECSSCEDKCGEEKTPCPRVCQPARCQCPAHKGFARNEDGKCIKC